MSRRLRYSLVAAACVVSPLISGSAGAQLAGFASRAADFAPVDASALGATRQSSIGLSAAGSEIVAGGALGIWNGAMHVYAGGGSYEWSTGLAYSRTAFAWPLVSGIHATLGEQLSTGYRRLGGAGYRGAVNLRVPAGLTLGDPDAASLAVYAAPYGELGIQQYPGTAYDGGMGAAGISTGVRASAGRIALAIMFTDVAYRQRFYFPRGAGGMLGLSVQLGK